MWPDETSLLSDLLDYVEFAPEQRMDRAVLPDGPAVYVWMYRGDRRGCGRHLDAYYQSLTLTGWPIYCGSAMSMSRRQSRHLRNLAEVRDLSADELEVSMVPMPSHAAALFAEALLIRSYQPVLNLALPGVGSARVQGKARITQAPSKFAIVHGRAGCGTGRPGHTADDLIDHAIEHLAETVRGVRRLRRRAIEDE